MNLRQIIGQRVRHLREQNKFSQEALSERVGITYQYLSSIENGKENVTVGVLESLAGALDTSVISLLSPPPSSKAALAPPVVDRKYFRRSVPLPGPMTIRGIEKALNETQRIVSLINANLLASGARTLQSYIQGNNFSGLVSNMLCDSLDANTPFKHNSDQAYPDLITKGRKKTSRIGLEVKSTINIGKGGESHNGHSGWHLIACFRIDAATGNIHFIHIMIAPLNGHKLKNPDWKYLGSKENPETGSRRTETYTTNLQGLTKLRDGSVYLDHRFVNFSRWRKPKRKTIPAYSIFWKKCPPI